MSQADKVTHQIDVLIDSGVTSKTEIYDKILSKTGLPRSSIRRITGQYKKKIEKKITILTSTSKQIEKKDKDPYYFLPKIIKSYWKNMTENDLLPVYCLICRREIAYHEVSFDSHISVICPICKSMFPKGKKK